MPDNDYTIDLRDIRFTLFEHLPFGELTALEAFAEYDRESVELVLDECFKFNRDVMAPLNHTGDEQACSFADGVVTSPEGFKEAYHAFCENGWLGASSPMELGGMGLPNAVGIGIGEMYIGANCSLSLSLGLTRAAAGLLQEYGTEEMKEAYLEKMMSGQWQGTMCLTESQAGSAVGDIRTLAKRDGDSWLVEGNKIFITAGDHDMCDNHVHLVLARTPGAPKGFKGISLFVVPKYLPADDGGVGEFNDVRCTGIEHKLGIKGSPTCTLSFGEDGGCRGWLIGEEGRGLLLMFHMMNEARIGVGLQGLALAAQAYNYAREYALERIQGVEIEQMRNLEAPRIAISEHPDVRRMLLVSKAVVEGCRALLYKAAYYSDLTEHLEDEERVAHYHGLLEILTPICKAWCSDRAFEVTTLAVQVMGGYGYCSEYPVEQHLRDVKIASIYEGTNGIQALDLLGRKLAMKAGALFRALLGEIQGFLDANKGHFGLSEEIATLSDEVNRWTKVTMDLGTMGMSGDQRYPVLSATPYLEMAGNAVVAWLLLEQAVVAWDKLQALYIERDARTPEARDALLEDDLDARFYANKLETARCFLYQVTAKNQGIAASIGSGDRSVLRYRP